MIRVLPLTAAFLVLTSAPSDTRFAPDTGLSTLQYISIILLLHIVMVSVSHTQDILIIL